MLLKWVNAVFESLKMGIESIKENKLRSFLTLLGMVIGVAAVITIVIFGEGANIRVARTVEEMGPDVFWIEKKHPFDEINMEDGGAFPEMMGSFPSTADKEFITKRDISAIRKYCSRVKYAAPIIKKSQDAFYHGKQLQMSLNGTTSSYKNIGRISLIAGRFLMDVDNHLMRKVCVLEQSDAVKKIFRGLNPVGKSIKIQGEEYEIIGLIEKKDVVFGGFEKFKAYLPINTLCRIIGKHKIDKVYFSAADSRQVKEAKRQVKQVLLTRNNGKEIFKFSNVQEIMKRMQAMTKTVALVISGIAAISLLVGGIGIMNIMLVSVTERTREIGIRRAIGAKRLDILLQFIIEAIILSLFGGIIGIIIGTGLGISLAPLLHIPSVISLWPVLVGFLFSAGIGIASGFYPALKASNLIPIEALRYE